MLELDEAEELSKKLEEGIEMLICLANGLLFISLASEENFKIWILFLISVGAFSKMEEGGRANEVALLGIRISLSRLASGRSTFFDIIEK